MKRTGKTPNSRLSTRKDRYKQIIIRGVVRRRRGVPLGDIFRKALRVSKVLILLGVCYGLYWGGTEGYRKLFWENPDYALKEIEFRSDGTMTKERALKATGIEEGKNIFSYDINVASDTLRKLPEVADVEIRRYLPSRLDINVIERKAIAWVTSEIADSPASAAKTHLMDASGLVFEPKSILREYRLLPVICGVDPVDIRPGSTIHTLELEAALQLLEYARKTREFQAQMIDISKCYCLTVTDQKNTQITFGLDGIDEQIYRLGMIQNEAMRYGQDIKTVNLMVARNTPVVFATPAEPHEDIDAALLGEEPPKQNPRPNPPKPALKSGKPVSSPDKKEEPKPRNPPTKNSLLKPFRNT